MFNFSFQPSWPLIFGSVLFSMILGTSLRAETRTAMASLICAILTDSYIGVMVGALLSLAVWSISLVRKVG